MKLTSAEVVKLKTPQKATWMVPAVVERKQTLPGSRNSAIFISGASLFITLCQIVSEKRYLPPGAAVELS